MSRSNKADRKKQYIRIGALVIAGIMVVSVLVAVVIR